jgi:carbon storage regulator CsrA
MLVLTRKQGEQIRIGEDVVITVVRTKGKAVRLGIQAPAHVPVLRGEIAAAISNDEERKASGGEERDEEPWPGAESPSVGGAAVLPRPLASTRLVRLGRSPLRELLAARGV